ncbi:MAG: hypothetical protein WCL23_04765 [Candidatus Moraniibacteriota bacterium]
MTIRHPLEAWFFGTIEREPFGRQFRLFFILHTEENVNLFCIEEDSLTRKSLIIIGVTPFLRQYDLLSRLPEIADIIEVFPPGMHDDFGEITRKDGIELESKPTRFASWPRVHNKYSVPIFAPPEESIMSTGTLLIPERRYPVVLIYESIFSDGVPFVIVKMNNEVGDEDLGHFLLKEVPYYLTRTPEWGDLKRGTVKKYSLVCTEELGTYTFELKDGH